MEIVMVKDVDGNEVKVGDLVTVLSINPLIWKHLPDDEKADLQSMIGEELRVYEVSEKYACVEKVWDEGGGSYRGHSLSLKQPEIKLAKK